MLLVFHCLCCVSLTIFFLGNSEVVSKKFRFAPLKQSSPLIFSSLSLFCLLSPSFISFYVSISPASVILTSYQRSFVLLTPTAFSSCLHLSFHFFRLCLLCCLSFIMEVHLASSLLFSFFFFLTPLCCLSSIIAGNPEVVSKKFRFAQSNNLPLVFTSAADGTNVAKVNSINRPSTYQILSFIFHHLSFIAPSFVLLLCLYSLRQTMDITGNKFGSFSSFPCCFSLSDICFSLVPLLPPSLSLFTFLASFCHLFSFFDSLRAVLPSFPSHVSARHHFLYLPFAFCRIRLLSISFFEMGSRAIAFAYKIKSEKR